MSRRFGATKRKKLPNIYFLIAELARCEKFGSEVYRQDLVSLTPEDTQTTYSVNDATVISCNGTDIKWKNPFGHYVTNLAGRVHVEDSSTYNDEVHVLRLVFEKIESKDSGVWTCEGNYGKKSFEMIVYGEYFHL